jgi:Family of unknown function (DUF6496)
MARSSPGQRKTAGRVMHEFKHGELKSGRGGKGGKVKSRKQAIAIAMHESGTSRYDSPSKRRKSLAKSKRKEARGATYQQEREGKSRVGARGKRESSRAMGGENATRTTRRAKSRPTIRGRMAARKARIGTRIQARATRVSTRVKARATRVGTRVKARATGVSTRVKARTTLRRAAALRTAAAKRKPAAAKRKTTAAKRKTSKSRRSKR